MLIAVKSKRFSVTGYKRMFVILIKKTLGSGFKYSAFDYCVFYRPLNSVFHYRYRYKHTVKILKFGTPEIITVIVLQLEQLDFTVQ